MFGGAQAAGAKTVLNGTVPDSNAITFGTAGTDVDQISSWVGQGTGVPFARVDYSGAGSNQFSLQSGLWRRYDLNGDGLVTAADVAWVQAEVGRRVRQRDADPHRFSARVMAASRYGATVRL